jgi:predicted Zn-dependent protease with MMP-like domain
MQAVATMDRSEFEALIDEVVAGLPEWVRDALENITILVEEEPGEISDPNDSDLLGLYTGIPLTERDANHSGELPDVIYIFRLPHLALGLPAPQLREEVARTVMHEIAHYFGIGDEHLEDIGWG